MRLLILLPAFLTTFSLSVPMIGQTSGNPFEKIIQELNLRGKQASLDSAMAIFDWVTGNISYDTDRKFRFSTSRDTFYELARRVALERKAVCLGYAALFKRLCDISGIPAFVVKGRVYISKEDIIENHAWVVFRTGGKWHHADPTWGAGHVAGHKFTFDQNWAFFDPEPEKFIATHYPFDPAFQLLETPITYSRFADTANDTLHFSDTLYYRSILKKQLEHDDKAEQLKRALRFKPEDPFLMHDLATYLQEEASSLVRDCLNEYNTYGGISQNSECSDKIIDAEDRLEQAVEIFEQLIHIDSPQKDMAWMNLAASKNNLKTIQILKQNIN